MRERLLSDVRARLERLADSQDPAVVTDPAALAEVAALLDATPDPGADLEVAHAAGSLHWWRFAVLGNDQADLAAALTLLEPVYRAQPDLVPGLAGDYLDAGGPAVAAELRTSAERARRLLQDAFSTGDRASLGQAIDLLRSTLATAPANHPDRAGMLSCLGAALRARFEQTGARADLDAAVTAGRQAVEATPADHLDRAGMLSNLGAALLTRFQRTGAPADLDAAVTAGQEAAGTIPAGHPDRATVLSHLADALGARFERTGDRADLDAALAAARGAAGAIPAGHQGRARSLSNLAGALKARFDRTGDLADLNAAVTTIREAVDATPAGDPDRAGMLSNLGGALQARFDWTGDLADLDAAVSALREAVNITPAGHPELAPFLSNLGGALHVRFDRTGELTDLNAAVTAGQKAVGATPAGHPDLAVRQSNLGLTLQVRSERTGDLADLDAAVTAARDAVGATPAGHPVRATMLGNLARALQRRYERTGALADLDAAIAAARGAIGGLPAGHPDLAGWQASLAGALLTRSLRTGAPADLDAAATAARDAAGATPAGHPNRAGMLSNLGLALMTRAERTGKLADLDAAVSVFREAATVEAASPRLRAVAAARWGLAAGAAGRWPEAMAAFAVTFDLLGLVAPRSLTRGDQEHLLADLGGLASHAAACCVRAGQADRAVELFEQGRGILLGQALDTRTDLTELAERHPGLAERFTRLRDDLDRAHDRRHLAPLAAAASGAAGLGDEAASQEAQRRRQTARAFDQLITSIRDMPGYAGFLRPPAARDLAAAAKDGPVVIVNPSQFGSHALVLTSGGAFEPVPLGDVTPERVEREVTGLLTALEDPLRPRATEERLMAVLGWLWDAIAGPVLARLGRTGPPAAGEAWPRLWWCLPGLLSFLPLHAAGHHDTRDDAVPQTVADRVMSSYTPTVRALLYARRAHPADDAESHDPAGGREDVLVVAMPNTPGELRLPDARREADLLGRRFPGRTHTLTGSGATYATVIRALDRARLVHFACHGTADPANPSASYLSLYDHERRPLTVGDVARLRLEHADLAFLSACSTARPGTRLTDEAIHLASAFQLAGFRHVIGTLWPVIDAAAAKVADGIYSALAGAGTADASAAALHAVTRQLRDRWPDAPSAWASHIHSGR